MSSKPDIATMLGLSAESLQHYIKYLRENPQEMASFLGYREDLITNVEQLTPILRSVCGDYETSIGAHIPDVSYMGVEEVCTVLAILNGLMRYSSETVGMIDRLDRYFRDMAHERPPMGES